MAGWRASRGSRLETAIARELRIPIFEYESGLQIPEDELPQVIASSVGGP